MSGFGALRQRTQEAAAPVESAGRCYAHGCPCRGTVSMDGGRFFCSQHIFAESDHWPAITQKLCELSWLVGFIDEIARMDRMHKDWRAFSEQFWSGQDDFCIPAKQETFALYSLRMRGELMHRCGLAARPKVREPKIPTSRGNAAGFLARRKAA